MVSRVEQKRGLGRAFEKALASSGNNRSTEPILRGLNR